MQSLNFRKPLSYPLSFAPVVLALAMSTSNSILSMQPPQDDRQNQSVVNFSEWVLMQPTGADAEFLMPLKPRYRERSFTPVQNQPPIKVRQHQATSKDKKCSFVFGYHDLYTAPTGAQLNQALDGAVAGSYVRVSGKLLGEQTKIRYDNYSGRAFKFLFAYDGKFHQVSARVFIVGKRQYFLQALFEKDVYDEEVAERFLDSFRIVKPDSDLPPRPPIPRKQADGQ